MYCSSARVLSLSLPPPVCFPLVIATVFSAIKSDPPFENVAEQVWLT
jgi:hypothetical protein